ncbi:MAG: hypothetical protein EOP04_25945 [Proteobacteria bacterium]|nr:MAG: hypothetical protein EOP04_25945 [Pseudomonadota bacterium]
MAAMFDSLLGLFSTDLAIDLGTANTIVVSQGAGVVFDQPSVCCFQAYDAVPRFVAAGTEAHSFVGKIAAPLKNIEVELRRSKMKDQGFHDLVADEADNNNSHSVIRTHDKNLEKVKH